MLDILTDSDLPNSAPVKDRPVQAVVLHGCRVLVFTSIVMLIALQARQRYQQQRAAESEMNLPLAVVGNFFPTASRWGQYDAQADSRMVLDESQNALGYVIQTSPVTDNIVGFSGPTNVLLAFNTKHDLLGIEVLWSRDTKEHLQQVQTDPDFLKSFSGINRKQAINLRDVEAVSGATLTSLAIVQAVVLRLGGEVPALKFPEPLSITDVKLFFEDSSELVQDKRFPTLWHVYDQHNKKLGEVLRTSPAADAVVGYQGPTDALVAIDPDGKVFRLWVRTSYDNEPYVGYLNQDWVYRDLFTGLSLEQLARYDLVDKEVEGVSGATMTSLAVAEGAIVAARSHLETAKVPTSRAPARQLQVTLRDLGTILVIIIGVVIAFTRWKGNAWVRVSYQTVLILYVGFINGDLVSQAMLVGWAQNGLPWKSAISLIVMTSVAFIFPIVTKRNIYCSHLCPHGAIQQLVKNRVRKPHKLSARIRWIVGFMPGALLAWVVIVAILNLPFSLIGIEPFDAYLIRIAGWATIAIFVTGIIASLFIPMGYCKYGCPTGTLLEYLRRHRRSDQLTWKDGFAVCLLLLVAILFTLDGT